MKQWLYNGWFRFKTWVLFNYWMRVNSGEDYEDLVKLYYLKRWEKKAMNSYVNYLDTHPFQIRADQNCYIGTISQDWESKIDAKILQKSQIDDK